MHGLEVPHQKGKGIAGARFPMTAAKEVLGVIQKLNEIYKTTVVLITHNPSIGVMADRIVKLNSGEVVEIIKNKDKQPASEIVWG